MKLTYWIAECLTDSHCYNIRERTKKAAKAALADGSNPDDYGPIHKVTVEYYNAFDLMWQCAVEGRFHWED